MGKKTTRKYDHPSLKGKKNLEIRVLKRGKTKKTPDDSRESKDDFRFTYHGEGGKTKEEEGFAHGAIPKKREGN